MVSFNFPKDFLFFQVHDWETTFKISESETDVSGGTGSEGTAFDSLGGFDKGDDFELIFGELMYLDDSCCFGSLSSKDKFGGLRDPFDIIGRVVETSIEMLDDLGSVDGFHIIRMKFETI